MTNNVSRKIFPYQQFNGLCARFVDELNNPTGAINFILLYAYNRVGKTRLSMEFKNYTKHKNQNQANTLYFNAYTEDLFYWNNDFINEGQDPKLLINSESRFFSGLKDLAVESKINEYLQRYANFDFIIDYQNWSITFYRQNDQNRQPIKISRGEEVIFIWCFFLAFYKLVLENHISYQWVKYIYIDDPVSSLDDNNTIALACDLAYLLKQSQDKLKVIISSHHGLFFNVMCNEMKRYKHKKYFLYKDKVEEDKYYLQSTDEVPFFHHIANLAEIKQAIDSGNLYTYHFNIMRNVLEKTSSFLGYNDFSVCLSGFNDEVLYARALNLLSHGNHSLYEPREMSQDNKDLLKQIFDIFISKYSFNLPNLTIEHIENVICCHFYFYGICRTIMSFPPKKNWGGIIQN